MNWLPDMDLNHDKQIQSLLCYRYTIGQAGTAGTVMLSSGESRFVPGLKGCGAEPMAARSAPP